MWSVEAAWRLINGDNAEFPPPVSSAPTDEFTRKIAEIVAAYFGPVDEESIAKAHAAVGAVVPMLVEYPMPPAMKNDEMLHGEQEVQHIISVVSHLMLEYAKEVGVKKSELKHDLKAIQEWRLDDIKDWFYIYDALGSLGCPDQTIANFYKFAADMFRYRAIGPRPPASRATKKMAALFG